MWGRWAWLRLLFLAAAGAGCGTSADFSSPWLMLGRAPTARITQSDVVALNEAVALIANSQDARRYEEASKKLAELLPRFQAAAEPAFAAETTFWLAYCYEKTGRKEDAAVFYDQLVRKYPQSPAAEQAKARRQQLEFKRPPE